MLLASYVRPRQAQPFTDLSDLETLPRGRVFADTECAEGTERKRGREIENERDKSRWLDF